MKKISIREVNKFLNKHFPNNPELEEISYNILCYFIDHEFTRSMLELLTESYPMISEEAEQKIRDCVEEFMSTYKNKLN